MNSSERVIYHKKIFPLTKDHGEPRTLRKFKGNFLFGRIGNVYLFHGTPLDDL